MSFSRPNYVKRPRYYGGVELQAPDERDELDRLTQHILFGAMTDSEREAVQKENEATKTREDAHKETLARHAMSRKKAKKVRLVATACASEHCSAQKAADEASEDLRPLASPKRCLIGPKTGSDRAQNTAKQSYVVVVLGFLRYLWFWVFNYSKMVNS